MRGPPPLVSPDSGAQRIRVTGTVQGVGFRPTVWRLAGECGIRGWVRNDADGVLIHAWGEPQALADFVQRLWNEPPPLARIDAIDCAALEAPEPSPAGFLIEASGAGAAHTGVAADAATCPACLAEVLDPANRRYRYPFTNCTHCGPRLSIVEAIPYDRANTSMAAFSLCPPCQAEYDDPADRRFHAQPNACPQCGPRLRLVDAEDRPLAPVADDDVIAAAASRILEGAIVAIKGIGGIQLACDATNAGAVQRLRRRKRRHHKPLALMARDLAMVRRHARVDPAEAALLEDRAAPIVVLRAAGEPLPEAIAPGQDSLGFMLPGTPLHHLLLRALARPMVLTSGNRSDEPQAIDNADARRRLASIADAFLLHDRDIVIRLDDSLARVMDGRPRLLRRARGYAPQPIPLPAGFDGAPQVLALGGELKSTFCLLKDGQAILSQHLGDLEDAATWRDYRRNLQRYRRLFDARPAVLAVDRHADYLSTQLGRSLAAEEGLALVEVQHHHAHIAACMAEHGLPLDGGKVLGVALDGLGLGADGDLWGGEFLLADYRDFVRLAHFHPLPLPGGAQAMREPWRNTFAHLHTALGWERVAAEYAGLDIVRFLAGKPLGNLRTMMETGLNSPLASSAGRLFDAVAAALGLCRESVGFEGQAAMALEALAAPHFARQADAAYGVAYRDGCLVWRPLWLALLGDLRAAQAPGVIAARFHQGLAAAVADTAARLCRRHGLATVVLGGGVFQNRLLLEGVSQRLRQRDLRVLSPAAAPANDGGLSLGQAVVALSRAGIDDSG